MKNAVSLGIFLVFAVAILGLVQLYLTFVGIWHVWGLIAAIIAIVVTFVFRTSVLLLIGTYMGAVHVWGWPWWGAVLIAIPAVFFLIPGAILIFFKKFGMKN
ncbi:hypothetical protein GT348_02540 [Aristophania vespae]|uniref:Uncharacterized protein n=1 Tax=Aristophania vespae TaxID=2697033 RepID=A0A6P1NKC0_9PROT|nr:hypothetical protein [Aristophania vespae]QHI95301.1 hypothetical protein GT348_02540 [Aristophania vespae]UMM64557.1 hypothetical protein DM15PD_15730 [Aristophania vespae]